MKGTRIKFVCFILIICFALVSCGGSSGNKSTNTEKEKAKESTKYQSTEGEIVLDNFDETIGDDVPISRGEVAKIIALTLYDKNEIENVEQAIKYKDVDEDNVYYKYIQILAKNSIMAGDSKNFRPNENLTLNETAWLLEKINVSGTKKVSVNEETKEKSVSYGLWSDLFIKTLEELTAGQLYEKYKLVYTTPIVLATNKDRSELKSYVITDNGKLNAQNLDLSAYRDCEIGLYEKNGNIVAVKSFISSTPTIENAYIYNYQSDKITIFAGGVYRDYEIVNGEHKEDINGSICDIKISGTSAKSINVSTLNKTVKVRKIDGDKIEFNDGAYSFDENFKIYGNYLSTLTFESKKNIRVGATMKFITKGDKVLASIIDSEIFPEVIRVLINDSTFKNNVHKEVVIGSTKGFIVGDKTYGSGEELKIDGDNYKSIFDNYAEIKPLNDGMLIIKSITRADGYIPKYRGILEVCKVDGGFNIISEVTMDEYLYQVVPSEMPSRYGVDASKVQAICARTYAYKQFYKGAYEKYGANVDDSTSSQVYNNIADTENSVRAVNETTGQIIVYDGEPIDAYFFSTTGGSTASSGDVWTTDINNFPKDSIEYLTATPQHDEGNIDLSDEDKATKFFKDKEVDAIEKDVDWFRWDFTLTNEELSTSINNNLVTLYQKRPELIQTLGEDGTYRSVPIDSVGLVKDINIIKRGTGGNVIELEIVGSEKTVRVYTELFIRSLIRPYQYIVGRKPIVLNMVGTSMKNYSLLPSSFFAIEKTVEGNAIKKVTIYGGGNGHSVGLSQNGANELLKQGKTIDEVIAHYYSGAVVKNIGEK